MERYRFTAPYIVGLWKNGNIASDDVIKILYDMCAQCLTPQLTGIKEWFDKYEDPFEMYHYVKDNRLAIEALHPHIYGEPVKIIKKTAHNRVAPLFKIHNREIYSGEVIEVKMVEDTNIQDESVINEEFVLCQKISKLKKTKKKIKSNSQARILEDAFQVKGKEIMFKNKREDRLTRRKDTDGFIRLYEDGKIVDQSKAKDTCDAGYISLLKSADIKRNCGNVPANDVYGSPEIWQANIISRSALFNEAKRIYGKVFGAEPYYDKKKRFVIGKKFNEDDGLVDYWRTMYYEKMRNLESVVDKLYYIYIVILPIDRSLYPDALKERWLGRCVISLYEIMACLEVDMDGLVTDTNRVDSYDAAIAIFGKIGAKFDFFRNCKLFEVKVPVKELDVFRLFEALSFIDFDRARQHNETMMNGLYNYLLRYYMLNAHFRGANSLFRYGIGFKKYITEWEFKMLVLAECHETRDSLFNVEQDDNLKTISCMKSINVVYYYRQGDPGIVPPDWVTNMVHYLIFRSWLVLLFYDADFG